MLNLTKTSLNICGPCKYRINTINKEHLDIPRCRINPKKVRLETIHVISWVLLKGLKAHVYGIRFLVKLVELVEYYIKIKGNFEILMISTGVIIPPTLVEIGWPKASCDKASFSQF